jgi:hypothetical protein
MSKPLALLSQKAFAKAFQLIFCIIASWSLSAAELIDVVYTWVDGSDPQWQALLTKYTHDEEGSFSPSATAKKRFTNHDELRYSLRSVHQFAPWVNHIFIVTFGQKPKWLIETPKISIVDHRDIFTNPKDLPTFNSMAIECHLHHIPGLQEQYVYFNDDVFLGNKAEPGDFFTETGKIKVFLSKRELPLGAPEPGEEGFFSASKNTRALLDANFGERTRYMHAHTPYPSIKSFVKQVEAQFPNIFAKVSSHRFRSLDDYTITNGLIPYVALHTNHGEQIPHQWATVYFGRDPSRNEILFNKLLHDQPLFFCIQDNADDEDPLSVTGLAKFFHKYFSAPAPWEKEEAFAEASEAKVPALPLQGLYTGAGGTAADHHTSRPQE